MAINRLDGQGLPERPDAPGKAPVKGDKGDGTRTAGRESTGRAGDRIELSREARRIGELRNAVADLPDIREGRVAELRDALSRGTYRVASRDLALSILKDPDAIAGK